MEIISNKIKQLYTEAFTLSKVKTDLFKYLYEDRNSWFTKEGDGYIVDILNDDTKEYYTTPINPQDEITFLSYGSTHRLNYFYYHIEIGIGNYTANIEHPECFVIEKAIAKLTYNDDLSLADIEFYITELNRKQLK